MKAELQIFGTVSMYLSITLHISPFSLSVCLMVLYHLETRPHICKDAPDYEFFQVGDRILFHV